jgi:hypothetical protein
VRTVSGRDGLDAEALRDDASLGAGTTSCSGISKNFEETLLQLGGDSDLSELCRRIHGTSVSVDERDARSTAFDVPLEQLTRCFRKAAVEIVTEEVGYLPALDR